MVSFKLEKELKMQIKKSKSVWINLIILSFLLFIFLSSFVAVSAQEIKLPPIKKTTLDNGLKVIVIEQHELPVVAFRLILKSGSACDPVGKAGLADLTAGLLRKGTKTKSSGGDRLCGRKSGCRSRPGCHLCLLPGTVQAF
jgi:hypothetical protein